MRPPWKSSSTTVSNTSVKAALNPESKITQNLPTFGTVILPNLDQLKQIQNEQEEINEIKNKKVPIKEPLSIKGRWCM